MAPSADVANGGYMGILWESHLGWLRKPRIFNMIQKLILLTGGQEVAGSNPVAPIFLILSISKRCVCLFSNEEWFCELIVFVVTQNSRRISRKERS